MGSIKKDYWLNRKVIDNIIYRKCNKCQEYKPETFEYFYYQNKKKLEMGFMGACRKCSIKSSMQYNIENPEKAYTARRRYEISHKETRAETKRIFNEDHRVEIREYAKQYYEKNKEKFAEYIIRREAHKHHDIKREEWESCKKYFNYECACCGTALKNHKQFFKGAEIMYDFCKDHFLNDGGNDLTNCIPLCKSCNCRKSKTAFEIWYNFKNINFLQSRLDKINQWIYEDCFKYLIEHKENIITVSI